MIVRASLGAFERHQITTASLHIQHIAIRYRRNIETIAIQPLHGQDPARVLIQPVEVALSVTNHHIIPKAHGCRQVAVGELGIGPLLTTITTIDGIDVALGIGQN